MVIASLYRRVAGLLGCLHCFEGKLRQSKGRAFIGDNKKNLIQTLDQSSGRDNFKRR
jgi:hypothetical protein